MEHLTGAPCIDQSAITCSLLISLKSVGPVPILQSYSDNAFVHIWREFKIILKLELNILFSANLFRPDLWEAVGKQTAGKFDKHSKVHAMNSIVLHGYKAKTSMCKE